MFITHNMKRAGNFGLNGELHLTLPETLVHQGVAVAKKLTAKLLFDHGIFINEQSFNVTELLASTEC